MHAGIADPPGSRHPPRSRPPWEQTPPPPVHAGRYGQQAGGMHPTGMQSCYWPQRSCAQGNIFAPVCHSVHRGGSNIPACTDSPRSRHHHPRADTTPLEQTPPGSRHPPGKQTPAYGQRAAGTHPTGMHSCLKLFSVCYLRIFMNTFLFL